MTIEQYQKESPYSTLHYLQFLRKLLPRGRPWGFFSKEDENVLYDVVYTGQPDVIYDTHIGNPDLRIYDTVRSDFNLASTLLGKFLSVFAEELKIFTDSVYQLVNESIAGLSTALLPEWINETLDNNDEWDLIKDSTEDQRLFAQGKLYNEFQTVTIQFFIDYAALLGFTIIIDETPIEAQIMTCSVSSITNAPACGIETDPIAQPYVFGCGIYAYIGAMIITVTAGTGNYALMQNLFNRAKPAHVVLSWVDAR